MEGPSGVSIMGQHLPPYSQHRLCPAHPHLRYRNHSLPLYAITRYSSLEEAQEIRNVANSPSHHPHCGQHPQMRSFPCAIISTVIAFLTLYVPSL